MSEINLILENVDVYRRLEYLFIISYETSIYSFLLFCLIQAISYVLPSHCVCFMLRVIPTVMKITLKVL